MPSAYSVTAKLQDAVSTAINGTAFDVSDAGSVTFQVIGTFTNITVNWEGTLDDTNWAAIQMIKSDGTYAATATAVGVYRLPPDFALSQVRARTTIGSVTGSLSVIGRKYPRPAIS
jgi:hypothetical protein